MTFHVRGISSFATAPPPGTIQRGELLIDAQTRTMWLGVDPALNPSEALLISDIAGMQAQIDALEVELRTYIDQQIATRSPVGHHHPISDVDGLQEELNAGAASVPPYCIIVYSGSLANIPVGFVICNGANGTPNLIGRFVLCADGSAVAQHQYGGNWYASGTTDVQGNHSHGGTTQYHALDWNQMPPHAHGVTDPGHAHYVNDPGHHHLYQGSNWVYGNIYSGGSPQWHDVGTADGGGPGKVTDYDAPGHVRYSNIWLNAQVTSIAINNAGSGWGHAHVMSVDGGHAHNLSNVLVQPPYYALAYIMKLP
jgi:hypothetical protein